MSPREPTNNWFENLPTTHRAVMPDNTWSHYLTVNEYARLLSRNDRHRQRMENRRLMLEAIDNEFLDQIEREFGTRTPNPPRNPGETMLNWRWRLRTFRDVFGHN